MNKYLNKNKNTTVIYYFATVIVITGFLLLFSVSCGLAQEANTNLNINNENINTNTNTTAETNTNTETTANPEANINNQQQTEENKNLTEINQEIDTKRQALEELKKKTQTYEENLKIKQQEALNLNNQLAILDIQLSETSNQIQTVKVEIEQINLEIESLILQIAQKEEELSKEKDRLSEFVRILYYYDQKTYLEIFIVNNSFSDFFNQLKYARELEKNVKASLDEVKLLKQDLEDKRQEREGKKNELEERQTQLQTDINDFEAQKEYKESLLEITKSNEQKFEELLTEAKAEQEQANAEISTLEEKAREKLEKEGVDLNEEIAELAWPVSTEGGITAYFHDPTYIFRKYFEHPGIDISVSQGSEVGAAANGYIARAKNAGMGYSYVMIIHNNSLSTVYGHLSRIDVAEDTYVVKGQAIGLSGGIPGTVGAGRMTTGAHLHFEVRVDGLPVNPLDYLPSI